MKHIYTIGYEGSSVDQLLDTLRNVGVEVLADVRELPLSRKKGLSKKSLAASANERGLEYLHFRDLGDPKPGREAARGGDYQLFEAIYLTHLQTEAAQSALSKLLMVARSKVTCLLCFERCADQCHRSYIADIAANSGFEVYNLVADRPEKYLLDELQIPRYYPRQGLSAAE